MSHLEKKDSLSEEKSVSRRDFFKTIVKRTAIATLGISAISLCLTQTDAEARCVCCTGCTSGCRGCTNVRY